jgi:hypothetical protein
MGFMVIEAMAGGDTAVILTPTTGDGEDTGLFTRLTEVIIIQGPSTEAIDRDRHKVMEAAYEFPPFLEL